MNKLLRWAPAVVAPVLVAAAAIAAPALAAPTIATPAHAATSTTADAVTPQSVLALIAKARDAHYSGTVHEQSDLGLPQLPTTAPGGSDTSATAGILELLTAPHNARVFADGPGKQRVQLLDTLAERDVIRNGSDVWIWDSARNTAVHLTLPGRSRATADSALSPAELANRIVKGLDSTTTLTVTTGDRVAGRPVYQLELRPKTDATLVGSVGISVDTRTGLPLAVAVSAHGQKSPALSVAFSSIDFATPPASTFSFTPPPGASVTTKAPSAAQPKTAGHLPAHTVSGSGWSAVLELPTGALGDVAAKQPKLFDELTTPVAGGRALTTSLLSVLVTSDGRVFAGAVPIATLEAAAR